MRPTAAAPRGPAAAIEPRRFAAARWPGRRSLPRPARRGGGGGAPGPYPSAAPPPPGPGPPPSGQRSPPSSSDCFGSNGGAARPGSRRLLGFGGPPRPFVVLLLPLAGPGAPPAAPTRASPLGARASPPRSGVSSLSFENYSIFLPKVFRKLLCEFLGFNFVLISTFHVASFLQCLLLLLLLSRFSCVQWPLMVYSYLRVKY